MIDLSTGIKQEKSKSSNFECSTYAKAYVRYIERTKDNKKKTNAPESLNDEFYKLFFRKGKERFDEYFKTKILYSIKQKFETEKYVKVLLYIAKIATFALKP